MSLSKLRGFIRSYGLLPPRDDFRQLLNAVLPKGEGVVVMIEAYFDESGIGKQEPLMCVAGYIFSAAKATRFSRKWSKALKGFGIEYFRMSECAARQKQFKGRTREECDEVAFALADLTNACAIHGVVVSASQSEFAKRAPSWWEEGKGGTYTACLHQCINLVSTWADNDRYNGRIAYFFEEGCEYEKEARRVLMNTMAIERNRAVSRYGGHAFLPKGEMGRPLDAADLLAWQVRRRFGDDNKAFFQSDDIPTYEELSPIFKRLQDRRSEHYSHSKLTGVELDDFFARIDLPPGSPSD